MSRGRDVNTAHVTTLSGVEDPAQGRAEHALHRDPVAVLAAALDPHEQTTPRSAVATATESAHDAGSVRTAAELLADAAQLAATERTTIWLDQLAAAGVITTRQRAQLAAEDGAASLTRVLRRAELAGHDPHQVLHTAIADRPLDGSRSLTNVICSRIRDEHRFDPVGESFTDWIPRTDNREWSDYLAALAAAADERADALGAQTAAERPAWALDTLGPPPETVNERAEWQHKAGIIAAYRELRDHNDDGAEALGPAPKPGDVEAYAAYRAAWRALGRPETDRAEHEMSDGQLRVRVRAYQRELLWAPRYVGNELAGTRQAAATYHQTAALRAAEAAAATDVQERARLQREAGESAALAAVLDDRAAQLQKLDDTRAEFLAHTAATRAAADRAQSMLAERHADDTEPEQLVTAEEWLAAHRAAIAEDEQHRAVTEDDITDRPGDAASATADSTHRPHASHDVEMPDRDLREIAAEEPRQVGEDVIRVPSADETAPAIERAHRAIVEIRARNAADAQEEAEHRATELNRWYSADQTAEQDERDALDDADGWFAGYEPAGYDRADAP
jgi:hypothetical protein